MTIKTAIISKTIIPFSTHLAETIECQPKKTMNNQQNSPIPTRPTTPSDSHLQTTDQIRRITHQLSKQTTLLLISNLCIQHMIKRTMEEQKELAASVMDVKRCLPMLHPLQRISLLKELLEVTEKYYQTVITISHCKKYVTQDTLPDIEALITSDLLKT